VPFFQPCWSLRIYKPSSTSIVTVEGTPIQPLVTFPLTYILGDTLFTHSFLLLPNCPTPLLGRDILTVSGHPHLTSIPTKAMTYQSLISILTVPPHFHRWLASTSFSHLLALTGNIGRPHCMGSQKPLCCLTSWANCHYCQRSFYCPKPISVSHLSNPPTGSKAYYLRASR
jgi:hypothetical protein